MKKNVELYMFEILIVKGMSHPTQHNVCLKKTYIMYSST